MRGPRHKLKFQLRNSRQRPLGAADQLRQVEAGVLRQVMVDAAVLHKAREVVAAAAPPVARRARNDRLAVALVADQRRHSARDLAQPVRLLRLVRQLRPIRGSQARRRSVVEDHLHLQHVVRRHAVNDGVAAAGVVGDDAAQAGAVAGSRVGAKLQIVGAQQIVKAVEHDARLHAHPTLLAVQFEHAIQVARSVDHQRPVDGLPGQAAAPAARQQRYAMARGQLHRSLHVVGVLRNQHAMRHHLVEAGICTVERACVKVGAQFPCHARAEVRQEIGYGHGTILTFRSRLPLTHPRRKRQSARGSNVYNTPYACHNPGLSCTAGSNLPHGPDMCFGKWSHTTQWPGVLASSQSATN